MNAIRPDPATPPDRKPFAIHNAALVVLAAIAAFFAGLLVLVFNADLAFAWLLIPLFGVFVAFILLMRKLPVTGRSWITASAMPWQQREGWGIFVAVLLYYIVPFLVQGFVGRAFQDDLPSEWLTWWLYIIVFCGYLVFSYRLVEEYCNYRSARVAPIEIADPPPITGTIPVSPPSALPTLDIPARGEPTRGEPTQGKTGAKEGQARENDPANNRHVPKKPYADPGNWEI